MNDDEEPLAGDDLLEHGLEPLLELAAELRARDERAHVQRHEPLVLETLGHVAVHDALREPFDDGRLADARLADEHRIVLRAAREHLDHAADLLVAADHRIELALPRGLGEVAGEALERLVLLLGILVRHLVRAAHLLERLEELLARRAEAVEQAVAFVALHGGEREQEVLGADVVVLQLLGILLGAVEDLIDLARERRIGAAALLGIAGRLLLHARAEVGNVHTDLLQEWDDDPFFLREQRLQEVAVVDERIPGAAGDPERILDGVARFDGEFIWVQHRSIRAPKLLEQRMW